MRLLKLTKRTSPWACLGQAVWLPPGKNTGVGCHFLLQGIFRTQGSNLCLLHRREVLYCLSQQGSAPGCRAEGEQCGQATLRSAGLLVEPSAAREVSSSGW